MHLAWCAILSAGCAGTPRQLPTAEQLLEAARAHQAAVAAQREQLTSMVSRRLQRERTTEGAAACFDVLVLSGGGQYGAFGAGVLRGWERVVDGPFAIPQFDLVTGVSTGSLIAPFAFAGSADEIDRVEAFYREARKELAVLRGLLFFLPWRDSFFDVTGLERTLDDEIAQNELDALRKGAAEDRGLLVATTNLDLGVMRVWDLGQEVAALDDSKALVRIRRLLRGSASIPAAFPAVTLDGHLHVDGGVAESLFLPGDALANVFLAPTPCVSPLPTLRLWVIVNGKISAGIHATSTSWTSVAARSSRMATHMSMATEMRRIENFSRWLNAAGVKVEYRYLALPEDFDIPAGKSDQLFDAGLMARLADLGESLGSDPTSWRVDPPRPESLTADLPR